MAQERFGNYLAYVTYAGPTQLNFYQLGACSLNPGNTFTEEYVSGLVARQATILSHAEPTVSIRTADFDTLAGVVSIQNGLNCAAGNSVFWTQKRTDGGTFAGAGNHTMITCTKGFLVMDRISARQDDPQGAMMQFTFHPLFDGTNEPLAQTLAQNLPVAVPAFVSQYYLGKLVYNGNQIEGVQGFEIESGVRFAPKRADGDAWARKGSIVQTQPKIKVTLDGTLLAAASASFFNKATSGNFDLYLRKGTAGGVRVADASASHIRIRFGAASANIESHEAEGLGDAGWTWSARPHGDLAIATGVAIP